MRNSKRAPCLSVRCGEVVRIYLTDTANTRVFNGGAVVYVCPMHPEIVNERPSPR